MLRWASGTLLAAALATAAQAALVDRVQIMRAGLWSQGDGSKPVFVKATEVIPAKIGTIFGIEWRPSGRASEGTAYLKIRWLYPPPGMQHPITRVRRESDAFDYPVTPGTRETTLLELNSEAMLLPGKWTLEISDASRVLARQEFTLTTASAAR
jgi:hypothetical protein